MEGNYTGWCVVVARAGGCMPATPTLSSCLTGTECTDFQRCSHLLSPAHRPNSFTIFGLLIVPKQPWAWPSTQWWEGFTKIGSAGYPGPHSKMSNALCCYYIMYASRYFQGMVSSETLPCGPPADSHQPDSACAPPCLSAPRYLC